MTRIMTPALREALDAASASPDGATLRLTRVLESIGWRGADTVSPDEVAEELLPAVASCARDHGDVSLLYRQIAGILRACGPLLDGSLPPPSDYQPAAMEIVRKFVEDA